jgi:glycerol-3-phosphate acyltransferase PlsX
VVSANQSSGVILALDAMGGDNAPHAVLEGAERALKFLPDLKFRIFGDEQVILPLLDKYSNLRSHCVLIHTDVAISQHEKPSVALRQGAKSSMRLAINDVAEGKSHGIVSSGNTGALMAMSKFVLRTLPGVDRPAIIGLMPTQKNDIVMLDMGANLECSARNLFEFAVMGEAFCRTVLDRPNPKIGLLNVGSEEAKGHEYLREAAQMIRQSFLASQFHGFVEGTDVGEGTVDVVVSDGFTGNIAIKVAEGTADMISHELKKQLRGSLLALIGSALAMFAIKRVRRRFSPSLRNGGMFLGLNGIAVKSHGGTDAEGFANAIKVTYNIARNQLNEKIIEELRQFTSANEPQPRETIPA